MQSPSYQRNTELITEDTLCNTCQEYPLPRAASQFSASQPHFHMKKTWVFSENTESQILIKVTHEQKSETPPTEITPKYYCVQHMDFGYGAVIFSYLRKIARSFFTILLSSCIWEIHMQHILYIILVLTEYKRKGDIC